MNKETALNYINTGRIKEGIFYFRKLAQDNAEKPDLVLIQLGDALYKVKEYSEALFAYQEACKSNPEHGSAQAKVANTLYSLGAIDESIEHCKEKLKLNIKGSEWVYVALGDIYINTNEINKAIIAYQGAINVDDNNSVLLAKLADALHKNNNLKSARKFYYLSLKKSKRPIFWIHIYFEKLLLDMGKFHEAIYIYEKAIKLEPNNADYSKRLELLKSRVSTLEKSWAKKLILSAKKFFFKIHRVYIPNISNYFFRSKTIKIFGKNDSFDTYVEIPNSDVFGIFKGREIRYIHKLSIATIYPPIDPGLLSNFYQSDYWILQTNNQISDEYTIDYGKINDRGTNQYNYLKTFIKDMKFTRTIEMGAGDANITRALFKHSQHNDIIEPSDIMQSAHRKENKINNIFPSLNDVNNKYDLFLSSHSLEHVPNLDTALKKINSIVLKDGYIFFEIPNCNDVYWKYCGYWLGHTYYFNVKSLIKISNKLGWRIIDISEWGGTWEDRHNKVNCGYGKEPNPGGMYLRGLFLKTN